MWNCIQEFRRSKASDESARANKSLSKMDMLNADLLLKNEATSKGKGKQRNIDEDDHESGFHFIAFMPINKSLWKLDGLERQPMCLGMRRFTAKGCCCALTTLGVGECDDNWLGQAKPDIEARMAQYEEGQIEFAILALVRDPLLNLGIELAENIGSITQLTAQLDNIKPDWQHFETLSMNGELTGLLTGPDLTYGVTQKDLDAAPLSERVTALCGSDAVEEIVEQRQKLITAQAGLRLSIRDEQQSNQSDLDRAAARSCDYGVRLQDFVRKVKAKQLALDTAAAQAAEVAV